MISLECYHGLNLARTLLKIATPAEREYIVDRPQRVPRQGFPPEQPVRVRHTRKYAPRPAYHQDTAANPTSSVKLGAALLIIAMEPPVLW